ncbi:hypothetical protein [Streptomyces sp. NPDC051218]|uniref:hypothetical protein n=1 Tax=Streptomyces sp. NPDC051218 TaxID=3365645 RepID=UPI0037AB4B8F
MKDPEAVHKTSVEWWQQHRGAALMLGELDWQAVAGVERGDDLSIALSRSLMHYCRRQQLMPALTARQPEETGESLRRILSFEEGHPALPVLTSRIPADISGRFGVRVILEACCEYIEAGDWRAFNLSANIPESEVEIRGNFPNLIGFSEAFLEESDGEDVASIISNYIDECHPNCSWVLPQFVGEAYRALAAYPSERLMVEAFDHKVPIASVTGTTWAEWFTWIAREFTRHMSEHHSVPA